MFCGILLLTFTNKNCNITSNNLPGDTGSLWNAFSATPTAGKSYSRYSETLVSRQNGQNQGNVDNSIYKRPSMENITSHKGLFNISSAHSASLTRENIAFMSRDWAIRILPPRTWLRQINERKLPWLINPILHLTPTEILKSWLLPIFRTASICHPILPS